MPASLNDIYKAIGELTSEVTSLRRDLQEAERNAVGSARRADQHRTVLHRRMDEIVNRTGTLEGDMRIINKTVMEVKEVTDEVTRWKIAGMGALGVTGIAAGAIASLLTAYWHDVLRALRGN